jgi:hypothetical protein
MIWEAPNTTINAYLEGNVAGLTGTVSVKVLNADGTTAVANTTAGIIEIAARTYRAQIPGTGLAEGEYLIVWAHHNPTDDTEVATEELVITGNAALLSIGSGTNYITLAEVKAARDMTPYTYADSDILRAIAAASRIIDASCGRRFYADGDATSVKYYTPDRFDTLVIDDVIAVTSVMSDSSNDGTYEYTWPTTDYSLWPLNAAADGRPYTQLVRKRYAPWLFPSAGLPDGLFPGGDPRIKVTGQFGWPSVPDAISQATLILAARYLTRTREATFGVLIGANADAVRISQTDPDVYSLIRPYMRVSLFV